MSLLGDIIKKELVALLPELRKMIIELLDEYSKKHPDTPIVPAYVVPTPSAPPEHMVLFDLEKVPTEMNAFGIPGRQGIVLYSLCQAANGYPIPGESEELIQITAYYDKVRQWFKYKVFDAQTDMNKNPNLTITLIVNDAVDRFGFRLLPPTAEAFAKFGTRVNSGVIVPEGEYKHD